MDQTNLRYAISLRSHLEHLKREYEHLLVDCTHPSAILVPDHYISCLLKQSEMTTFPFHLIAALSSSSAFTYGYSPG